MTTAFHYKVIPSLDYYNNIPTAIAAQLSFIPADPLYQNFGLTYNTSFIELGTNDHANSKFIDVEDAIAFYAPTAISSFVTNANAIVGSTLFHAGNLYRVDTPIVVYAQPSNSNLTQIAAISGPISSDMIGLISQPNVASVKSAMALGMSDVSGLTAALAAKGTSSFSGVYTDLSNKPTIPVVQAYEGTTQRLNAFPIFKSGTVGSGVIAFHLTTDGTSGGTALFPNGVIQDSVNATVNDATASYQMSWAFSNSNKTLTVTANKLTTSNILTGVLGQAQANSTVVKLTIWGY